MNRLDALFVHNNFPAQFGFLATALKRLEWRVAAIGSDTAREAGVSLQRWKVRRGTGKDVFPLAVKAEADFLRGEAAAAAALALKNQGFDPSVIVGHPGWGETLFLHDVFPQARQVLHGEFYYHALGADVGFDPEFGGPDRNERLRVEAKNATLALAYLQAHTIVSPTAFQASQFPPALRQTIQVIHEGVDTEYVKPRRHARLTVGPKILDRSTPVITFVSRSLEPLRGLNTFMRAVAALQEAVPDVETVVIGAEERGYGAAPPAVSWKAAILAELEGRLDLSRIHFLGKVAHGVMLDALSIGSAHVYYTYPFVLSWSLLEAMALECYIIASDTPPLHDAITDGVDGHLLPFSDHQALAGALIAACRDPHASAALRAQARRTVIERFDRSRRCGPDWLKVIEAAARDGG